MLEGKTALVTGSIIGIGNATAHALAAEGCNIMMCGLGTPDEVEAARSAPKKPLSLLQRKGNALPPVR